MSSPIAEAETTAHSDSFARLREKIRTRQARFGVIGLGYVGLPLALTVAAAGFDVTGIEIDSGRVQAIQNGQSYITDVAGEELQKAVRGRRFRATTCTAEIRKLDAVSICVPTPLRKTGAPDMSYVAAAADAIAAELREGQLVILESTAYPGATEDLVLPILQSGGLKAGRDFFLAFSPERVDPGNEVYGAGDIPKVVGGITHRCAELAAALYGAGMKNVVLVSSAQVAEMVKLLENAFRSVNIALANEFARMCAGVNIDVWEVVKAASSKPFGFMPFYPGPGLGGRSIAIDDLYLQWKSKAGAVDSEFIRLADKVNSGMPRFIATRVRELLRSRGKALNGSRVHVLGVTYKRDIADARESPAIEVIRALAGCGAEVTFSDPFVQRLNIDGRTLQSVAPCGEALQACDIAIIATDHTAFDYLEIVRNAPLVFDTRNAAEGIRAKNLVRL